MLILIKSYDRYFNKKECLLLFKKENERKTCKEMGYTKSFLELIRRVYLCN